MDRVEAFPVIIKGQAGYDIRVNDEAATVQDYIEAVDRFIMEAPCFRSRQPAAETCLACDLCCRERIPVTIVDAYHLQSGALRDTFQKYLHVYIEDRVVDITMRLGSSGRCLYLDGEQRLCSCYQKRPLVCRTFICCPSTANAKALREAVVNCGEDELVRSWFKLKGRQGLLIDEAVSPRPDPADYPPTAFLGVREYSQVKIKDICADRLWKKLMASAKTDFKKEESI